MIHLNERLVMESMEPINTVNGMDIFDISNDSPDAKKFMKKYGDAVYEIAELYAKYWTESARKKFPNFVLKINGPQIMFVDHGKNISRGFKPIQKEFFASKEANEIRNVADEAGLKFLDGVTFGVSLMEK